MEIHNFNVPAKQIFWGNILLVICCAFYLAWWLLAFRPSGAIKGFATGWLLIPAVIAGLSAVTLSIKGILYEPTPVTLFSGSLLIWGGIAAYFLLMIITGLFFHRPVTTELLLIDGWAILALSEINVLFGMGRFSHGLAIFFAIVIVIATIISLVCYVLYYKLGTYAGYFDGMIPLFLAGLVTAGISVSMALQG